MGKQLNTDRTCITVSACTTLELIVAKPDVHDGRQVPIAGVISHLCYTECAPKTRLRFRSTLCLRNHAHALNKYHHVEGHLVSFLYIAPYVSSGLFVFITPVELATV